MAENNIMGLVGAFIGIAIMLGIGIQILGNSIQDCTAMPDYSVGEVASIAVGTAGNYSSAPTAAISGGGGTGATASVTAGAIANGFEVTAVTVTDGGRDYTTAPTVSFSGGTVNETATATATITSETVQTGWAGQCVNTNSQTQNAYTLLVIILIIVAAVAILSVIRMLG